MRTLRAKKTLGWLIHTRGNFRIQKKVERGKCRALQSPPSTWLPSVASVYSIHSPPCTQSVRRWIPCYRAEVSSPVQTPDVSLLDIHGSVHHDTVCMKMANKMQLRGIIYCSSTALHVSSDIIAHHQEHLNCIYSFWYYSHMSLPAAVMAE
jgi:hypothetical protein